MAEKPEDLPSGARILAKRSPAVWNAFAKLGEACAEAGPIEGKALRLVKLALAVGASSEGAVHSHCRRALREGVSPEELKHVAVLAVPTLGLPQAVRTLTWIEDVTDGPNATRTG